MASWPTSSPRQSRPLARATSGHRAARLMRASATLARMLLVMPTGAAVALIYLLVQSVPSPASASRSCLSYDLVSCRVLSVSETVTPRHGLGSVP